MDCNDLLREEAAFRDRQRPAFELDGEQRAVAGILLMLSTVADPARVINAVTFYLGQENNARKGQQENPHSLGF